MRSVNSKKRNAADFVDAKNAKFSANFSIHKLILTVNNSNRAAQQRLNDIDKRAETILCIAHSPE